MAFKIWFAVLSISLVAAPVLTQLNPPSVLGAPSFVNALPPGGIPAANGSAGTQSGSGAVGSPAAPGPLAPQSGTTLSGSNSSSSGGINVTPNPSPSGAGGQNSTALPSGSANGSLPVAGVPGQPNQLFNYNFVGGNYSGGGNSSGNSSSSGGSTVVPTMLTTLSIVNGCLIPEVIKKMLKQIPEIIEVLRAIYQHFGLSL